MGRFVFNGIEYTGEKFEIKKGGLYIDGHCVADLNQDTEYIEVTGDGTLHCDQKVIINSSFTGTINADKVIINGEAIGNINAKTINDNRQNGNR